jgi:hypothetical protein
MIFSKWWREESSSRYRLHDDLLDGRSRFAERVLGRGGRAC